MHLIAFFYRKRNSILLFMVLYLFETPLFLSAKIVTRQKFQCQIWKRYDGSVGFDVRLMVVLLQLRQYLDFSAWFLFTMLFGNCYLACSSLIAITNFNPPPPQKKKKEKEKKRVKERSEEKNT
jgi:hypothetical protein